MPIERCTLDSGGQGWRWGGSGKCYADRSDAEAQARAAYSAGYREKADAGDLLKYNEDQPRDDDGRWSDGGGASQGAAQPDIDQRAHMGAQLRASNRLMQMSREADAAGDHEKARELRAQSHARHAEAMKHQAAYLAQEKAKETARRRAETRALKNPTKYEAAQALKKGRRALLQGAGALLLGKLLPVDEAAHQAATSPLNLRKPPTEGQQRAGNYLKGHTSVAGVPITIENPAGSMRRPEWPPLTAHYGYLKRTEGADGDHTDVFVRPGTDNDWAGDVYVINQLTADGSFDEVKAMVGWPDERSAVRAYAANYPRGWRVGPVTTMTSSGFRAWVREGDHTVPA